MAETKLYHVWARNVDGDENSDTVRLTEAAVGTVRADLTLLKTRDILNDFTVVDVDDQERTSDTFLNDFLDCLGLDEEDSTAINHD